MNEKLLVTVSPHYVRQGHDTRRVMLDVLIGLAPALVAACVIFGMRALLLTAFSAACCALLEWVWDRLMKKPNSVGDLSALVTGVLLAFNVPVGMPLWQLLVGDFVAIIVVKMLFGGLGRNFVNPALVGRVVMMLSFPGSMTNYAAGVARLDALSSATPLSALDQLRYGDLLTLLLGRHGGMIGETCALALIAGGVYLMARRVIKPVIPGCYIASTLVFTFLFNGFNLESAVLSLFSGGLMLGAFFMATDYVTSPLTDKGRAVFAVGCGFLTTCIRLFSSYAEGVSFAILLMNLLVPYINDAFRTKPLGGVKS